MTDTESDVAKVEEALRSELPEFMWSDLHPVALAVCEALKSESQPTTRKLYKVEYGWEVENPDGTTDRGDLYEVDGVVRFMTSSRKRNTYGASLS